MFCSNCGVKLQDNSRFCSGCGARIQPSEMGLEQKKTSVSDYDGTQVIKNSDPKLAPGGKDGEKPILVIKPVFLPGPVMAVLIPFTLFLTLWGGGFFGGFGLLAVQLLGLDLPEWVTFVFFGLLFFIGIPIIGYTATKKSYKKTEYRFFRDYLEYYEGFWTIEKKTIKYDRITETGSRQGIIQRKYNLGTITLHTASAGSQGRGISVKDIEFPDKVYKVVQELIC